MSFLVKLFYLLSTGLLIPVIVLLLLFVLECGGFLRELRERRRGRAARKDWQQRNEAMETSMPNGEHVPGLPGLFIRQARRQGTQVARLEKTLAELEVEAGRRLGRMRLLLRIGPMLGLMGTLIPLGPALLVRRKRQRDG